MKQNEKESTKLYSLNLTAAQRAILEQRANQAGYKTVSKWIKYVLLADGGVNTKPPSANIR